MQVLGAYYVFVKLIISLDKWLTYKSIFDLHEIELFYKTALIEPCIYLKR